MISRSNEFKKKIMEISRYLVELLGYCSEGSNRLLVYEIVSNNSLQFHLHGKGKFKNNIRWVIRMKMAIGQPKLIHGNMKLNNILLQENFEPKISDYYYHRFPSVYNANRNLGYVAPEYMNDGEITTKFDVFSFGIILLQLITLLKTKMALAITCLYGLRLNSKEL
ncbi:proline-rich receptor-like protein kinase PERK1 isoform X1 [Manihot esculenta]|uniref:proline-rich receptor-like protein kinase PERK1 isoform X1 n=1 Tax=Manihot esculenta TaxID=3983 RepID=UPI000B5D8D2B|nr:proline-rich receptor-like protein kinase PERK1 isoform X1 [Manihot esculenta]